MRKRVTTLDLACRRNLAFLRTAEKGYQKGVFFFQRQIKEVKRWNYHYT